MPNHRSSPDALARQRALVARVIHEAAPEHELGMLGLWSAADERYLRQEIDRLMYEPRLPYAGEAEQEIVTRLERLAARQDWALVNDARSAAERWRAVDGWYYHCEPMLSKRDALEFERYAGLRKAAIEQGQWELKWFCELMLAGAPEKVADFKLDCKYILRRRLAGGQVENIRMVTLRNVVGERTEPIELPGELFAGPEKYRAWCLKQCGTYTWKGGQNVLADHIEDANRQAAWKTVEQITACGWHDLGGSVGRIADGPLLRSGIWFFGDCAFAPDGAMLLPDDDGIYKWSNPTGHESAYMLGDRGKESRFLQGRPMFHPDVTVQSLAARITEPPLQVESCRLQVSEGDAPGNSPAPAPEPSTFNLQPATAPTDAVILGGFFHELNRRLNENLGGLEGTVMLGSFLSYLVAPEIFYRWRGFPGLWVPGEPGSGKSTTVGWIMSLLGFNHHSGFGLFSNTTPVGLQMLAEQYSNLPVWLDEYRDNGIEQYKLAMIRSCFGRDGFAKFGVEREIRTSFIVAGQSTTSDPATRGRFPHVAVAQSKRQGDHLGWFQDHEQFFFLISRYLLQHRAEYARAVVSALTRWMADPENCGDQRILLAHSVSYAAWLGAVALFESHPAEEVTAFRNFMRTYTTEASGDVKERMNVNLFWIELINAFEADELELKCFKLETVGLMSHPPDAPNQGRWISYRLFLNPNPIISELQKFLKQRGDNLPLKRKDLHDALALSPAWIPGIHKRHFSRGAKCDTAWGFNLDLLPDLGYCPTADDDPALMKYVAEEDPGDPRMGPLFAIVEALKEKI